MSKKDSKLKNVILKFSDNQPTLPRKYLLLKHDGEIMSMTISDEDIEVSKTCETWLSCGKWCKYEIIK